MSQPGRTDLTKSPSSRVTPPLLPLHHVNCAVSSTFSGSPTTPPTASVAPLPPPAPSKQLSSAGTTTGTLHSEAVTCEAYISPPSGASISTSNTLFSRFVSTSVPRSEETDPLDHALLSAPNCGGSREALPTLPNPPPLHYTSLSTSTTSAGGESLLKRPLTLLERRSNRDKSMASLSCVSVLSMETLQDNARDAAVIPKHPPKPSFRGWSTAVPAAQRTPVAPTTTATTRNGRLHPPPPLGEKTTAAPFAALLPPSGGATGSWTTATVTATATTTAAAVQGGGSGAEGKGSTPVFPAPLVSALGQLPPSTAYGATCPSPPFVPRTGRCSPPPPPLRAALGLGPASVTNAAQQPTTVTTPSSGASVETTVTPTSTGVSSGGHFLSGVPPAGSDAVVTGGDTSVRVISYNILADRLVNSDRYDHCPPALLSGEYRIPLIKEEIQKAAPSILLLEEISAAVFERAESLGGFLRNTMHMDGELVTITDAKGIPRCRPPNASELRSMDAAGNVPSTSSVTTTNYEPMSPSSRGGPGGGRKLTSPPSLPKPPPPLSSTVVGTAACNGGGTAVGSASELITPAPPKPRHTGGATERAEASASGSESTLSLHTTREPFTVRRVDMEGVAIFYDRSRFHLIEKVPLLFNQLAEQDTFLTPYERKKLQLNSHNVALICVLRDRLVPSELFVVAAVHLIYNRVESQMWQCHQLIRAVERLKAKYNTMGPAKAGTRPPSSVSTPAFGETRSVTDPLGGGGGRSSVTSPNKGSTSVVSNHQATPSTHSEVTSYGEDDSFNSWSWWPRHVTCIIGGDFNAESASAAMQYLCKGNVPPEAEVMQYWKGSGRLGGSATIGATVGAAAASSVVDVARRSGGSEPFTTTPPPPPPPSAAAPGGDTTATTTTTAGMSPSERDVRSGEDSGTGVACDASPAPPAMPGRQGSGTAALPSRPRPGAGALLAPVTLSSPSTTATNSDSLIPLLDTRATSRGATRSVVGCESPAPPPSAPSRSFEALPLLSATSDHSQSSAGGTVGEAGVGGAGRGLEYGLLAFEPVASSRLSPPRRRSCGELCLGPAVGTTTTTAAIAGCGCGGGLATVVTGGESVGGGEGGGAAGARRSPREQRPSMTVPLSGPSKTTASTGLLALSSSVVPLLTAFPDVMERAENGDGDDDLEPPPPPPPRKRGTGQKSRIEEAPPVTSPTKHANTVGNNSAPPGEVATPPALAGADAEGRPLSATTTAVTLLAPPSHTSRRRSSSPLLLLQRKFTAPGVADLAPDNEDEDDDTPYSVPKSVPAMPLDTLGMSVSETGSVLSNGLEVDKPMALPQHTTRSRAQSLSPYSADEDGEEDDDASNSSVCHGANGSGDGERHEVGDDDDDNEAQLQCPASPSKRNAKAITNVVTTKGSSGYITTSTTRASIAGTSRGSVGPPFPRRVTSPYPVPSDLPLALRIGVNGAASTTAATSAFAHSLRFTDAYTVYCHRHPKRVSAMNPSANSEGKVLDHILFEDDALQCTSVLRLGERIPLPTATIPSDHYMIGVTLVPRGSPRAP